MAKNSTKTTDDNKRLTTLQPARLPYDPRIEASLGVDKASWTVLTDAIFPSAKSVNSIVLALTYCKQRGLDVFKRPVHIVPMYDRKRGGYVETIWPGISELRTTATRTNAYAGCDEALWGPEVEETFKGRIKKVEWDRGQSTEKWVDEEKTVRFHEWCQLTVYRMIGGQRCKFVGPKVYWKETYATVQNTDIPNDMWETRSEGQLEKCAEAAALRRAFPEELGNQYTAEEMTGRVIEGEVVQAVIEPDNRDAGPPRAGTAPAKEETKPETGDQVVWEDARADEQVDRDMGLDAQGEIEGGNKRESAEPSPRDQERTAQEETGDPVDDMPLAETKADAFADETAQEPEAPHFEPQAVPIEKGMTTNLWGEKYIPMMETSKTIQEVYKWVDLNNSILAAVKDKNPQMSARIKSATEAKLKALRSAGAVQPQQQTTTQQRDAGPPRASTAKTEKTKPAAKAKDEPPPPREPADNQPDTILKWADATLARIDDPDYLELELQNRVMPWLDKLDFPPDQSEFQSIIRKHEKRLGGD